MSEEPSQEILEKKENATEVEKIFRISALNRTRESLSASDTCPDRSGHLLEQALAKQIAIREAELDSFSLPKKNVSVIVRCSTPDPDVECRDNTWLGQDWGQP